MISKIVENRKRLKEILDNSFDTETLKREFYENEITLSEHINENFYDLASLFMINSMMIHHYLKDDEEDFNDINSKEEKSHLLLSISQIKMTLIYGLLCNKHSIEEIIGTIKQINYNDYLNIDRSNQLKTDIILICMIVDLFINNILASGDNKEIEVDNISDSKINESLELIVKKNENLLFFGVMLSIQLGLIKNLYKINDEIITELVASISKKVKHLNDNKISVKGSYILTQKLFEELVLPYETAKNMGLILNIIYMRLNEVKIIRSKVKELSIKTFLRAI